MNDLAAKLFRAYQDSDQTDSDRILFQAANKIERQEKALKAIDDWCKAYPLDIFPEPDFAEVRTALKEHGITLDSVSASNMRHVLNGVQRIISEALS